MIGQQSTRDLLLVLAEAHRNLDYDRNEHTRRPYCASMEEWHRWAGRTIEADQWATVTQEAA